MSILTKVENKSLVAKARSERINKGIAHAAEVLSDLFSTLVKIDIVV